MKHCTFKYKIEYVDGSVYEGWSPYRGFSIERQHLERFVGDSFQELKPASLIHIYDIFEISDQRVWMAHIRNTVEFRYLYMAKGFAADILAKYYPEDAR